MPFVISARLMQTPAADRLQVIEDAVIAVDDAGLITAVEPAGSEGGGALLRSAAARLATPPGSVLIPGLVDLHVHAPQWPQLGTGLDLPLERWLFEHTFPLEARYADPSFARPVWADMVDTLLRHGTTTATYFATIDVEAASALARAAVDAGQRAFVGRVAMDHPDGTPDVVPRPLGGGGRRRQRAVDRRDHGHRRAAAASSDRSSRRASPPPARTSCCGVSASSPRRRACSCRRTARSRTGRTGTPSSGSA